MSPRPTLTLLRAAAHADMAWKNGLGRTAEIARAPAQGDSFDWRLSIATIGADGAFSAFAGCERTLMPIAGGGLALDFADGARQSAGLFEAMRFSGDVPCRGRLLAGPARDLNVITRRAAADHSVSLVTAPHALTTTAMVSFIVVIDGALTIASNDARWRLDFADALRIDGPGAALRLMAASPSARAAIVAITASPS